jgi:membrane-associated phospholipid phosphatase
MLKESIVRFDAKLTIAITGWPAWLRVPFIAVTFIGQPVSLIIFAAFTAYLTWNSPPVVWSLAAALGAMLINTLLKHFVHRTRPDTLYVNRMYFKSSSFPSGHAFGGVVVFGLLAYIVAHYITEPWGAVAAVLISLLIASIGLSRIYLGAHYPTDVIAGWALGSLFLWGIISTIQP